MEGHYGAEETAVVTGGTIKVIAVEGNMSISIEAPEGTAMHMLNEARARWDSLREREMQDVERIAGVRRGMMDEGGRLHA